MMRWLTNGMALLACFMLTGCMSTGNAGLCEGFDRSMRAYNRMLRWHETENAGAAYFDPKLLDSYLKQADSLKQRGFTVADYRILSSKCLSENKSGEVVAEFDFYMMPSNRVKTIPYRQKWLYDDSSRSWILKTGLAVFE